MAIFILLAALVLQAQDSLPPTPGEWQRTGSLLSPRLEACVVSLPDGRVLVTGGRTPDGPLNSAEIYTPADGVFTPFTSMDKPRAGHRCLVLADSKVLLIGGDSGDTLTASVYDPAIDTWLPAADLGPIRTAFTATILDDTQILIAGGQTATSPLASLFLLNPDTFAATPLNAKFNTPRSGHTATLLRGGRVLFSGGTSLDGPTASVELFDPESDTMPLELPMITPRRDHTATLLTDGRVLILGGSDGTADLNSAEVFTPGQDTLTALSSRLATARRNHFAIQILGNGDVLIGGGSNSTDPLSTTELFSSETDTFSPTGALTAPRTNILAAMLPEGRVLAIGGTNNDGPSLACGVFSAITITFKGQTGVANPLFFQGDKVEINGTLSGGSNVRITFRLTRTLNQVSTDVSSRLLTTTLDLGSSSTLAAPMILLDSSDVPATFRLTATTNSGILISVNFTTRFRTTLSSSILPAGAAFIGQPARVSFRLSAENGSTTFSGTVSAIINSLSASTNLSLGNLGSLSICCLTQPGVFPVTVRYAGNTNFAPAASPAFNHTVVDNIPTLSIRPITPFRLLTPSTLEVQVNPPAGISTPLPTGTVRIGVQTVSLAQSSGTSVAKLSYTPTFDDRRNGNVCFPVTYGGDTAYKAAAPISQCFPVAPAPATLSISTPDNSHSFGESTPISVSLSFNPNLGLVSRTISLFRGQTSIGLVSLSTSSPGVATGRTSLVIASTLNPESIRAEYAASGDIDTASAILNSAMKPISTGIQIVFPNSAVLNPFTIGASICTFTPIRVPSLSGEVSFFDGTLNLGRVSVNRDASIPTCTAPSDGTSNTIGFTPPPNVSLTGVSRPSGVRQITASYSGFQIFGNGPSIDVLRSTSPIRLVTVQ